jgi:hypothetical protein
MAHFAKLGVGNIVEQVVVVSNDIATTEQAGVDFLNNLYKTRDVWKQTSYNNNIRKNYAGIGFKYDQTRDAFIAPKPFNSWILNEILVNGKHQLLNLMMIKIISGMKQLRIGS